MTLDLTDHETRALIAQFKHAGLSFAQASPKGRRIESNRCHLSRKWNQASRTGLNTDSIPLEGMSRVVLKFGQQASLVD